MQDVVDTGAHASRLDTEVLQPESDVALHRGVHRLALRVLDAEPHRRGQAARQHAQHVVPGDDGTAGDGAAEHVRRGTVEETQQRRLPSARRAGDDAQAAVER